MVTILQRKSEPQSLVAPSSGSGVSKIVGVGVTVIVGVREAKKPMGVSVAVAVDVGCGVILGNGVNVIVGTSVGGIVVTVGAAVGAAVSACAFPVIAKSGVSVAGEEAGAGSVTKQADAASTIAKAIQIGAFDLFMA